MLIRWFVLAVGVFLAAICLGFYRVYTPWGDDFAWILYCDYRFANIAQWFTRGTADYFLNFPGLGNLTPFFRPLTASSFYLASLGDTWMKYKSQLALNHILFLLVFWAYLKFLRRFTPLPTAARWLVGACFMVSPVWSLVYFSPTQRVHLLECACVLAASLVLPASEEKAPLMRVVLAACISAGAIFAHEVGVVAPVVVALTHYWTSPAPGLRRKAAREALLIVAISFSLYFSVRVAFFHVSAAGAYPLISLNATGLAFNCATMILRLFFPFNTYIDTAGLVGGTASRAAASMLIITLVAYLFLAVKLISKISLPQPYPNAGGVCLGGEHLGGSDSRSPADVYRTGLFLTAPVYGA